MKCSLCKTEMLTSYFHKMYLMWIDFCGWKLRNPDQLTSHFASRLVTSESKVLFQVYSHFTFKRNHLLGEARLDLHKQLVREQGKLDHTNIVLDLKVLFRIFAVDISYTIIADQAENKTANSHGVSNGTPSNGRSSRIKVGELIAMLDGMRIDT